MSCRARICRAIAIVGANSSNLRLIGSYTGFAMMTSVAAEREVWLLWSTGERHIFPYLNETDP